MKTERDKKLMAVWKAKHRDFKGITNGVRYVLVYRNGTMSVPLTSLTDAEIEAALPKTSDAVMREVGKAIEQAYPWGYRSGDSEP